MTKHLLRNTKASIAIFIGMGAFALIPIVRWALYETDHQFANIGTAICLVTAIVSWLIAFLRLSNAKVRWIGLSALACLGLVLLSLFEFRGFTGELLPTFRYRFQSSVPSHLFSNTPSHMAEHGALVEEANAASFRQFLGDERTGVINSSSLRLDWKENPPTPIWRIPTGAGWAGLCVANGYVWTLFQDEDREAIACIELISGREKYRRSFMGKHYEPLGGTGPRSTPTWFDGKVILQTATGVVACLEAVSGDVLWEVDILSLGFESQSKSESAIKWGRSGSPLVVEVLDRQLVVVPFGGDKEGENARSLIALDLRSGNEVWRSGAHQISYASPTLLHLDGQPQIVSVNEGYASGHDPSSGSLLWETDWPSHSNTDACSSQPVRVGPREILLSKGYAAGAKLVRVQSTEANRSWSVETVWKNHRVLKTKLTNAIYREGRLYGLSDGILECVDAATGERVWRKGRYGQGQCLIVNDHLLVTTEMGKLVLVQLEDGEKIYEQAVLDGVCWNYPAVAGPFVLVRNGTEIVCFYSGSQSLFESLAGESEAQDGLSAIAMHGEEKRPAELEAEQDVELGGQK